MSDPRRDPEQVVDAALQVPADRRAAFLEQACLGEDDLRRQVEELLRVHELAHAAGSESTAAAPVKTIALSLLGVKPGDRIGRYQLLQSIGQGGMGTVWMAEQMEPVRRQVALKLIRPGFDSGQVLARFEAERQALALMDHPNIAKVLDAGATPGGAPYFVMELVKGRSLTQFCNERRLSIRERLELFVPVCHAIQHAHQKGIIHRDLKPGNVLVALYDGVPVPKVIDFGIAKATGPRLTERTLFTEFGAIIGTLEYMSPEQAELNQLDIDTRSDIYSLGVLLYELLTGTTPLSSDALRKGAFDEILRRIREEEPPKPSTRLSQSKQDIAAICAQRQLEPAQLTRVVRGDLDWIVMKTLEKDRSRRYETANALAADILHHLKDEPVAARPPGQFYRFQKTVRRNKLAFAAGAAVMAALVIGLGVATSFYFREKAAAGNSRQIAAFLHDLLNGVSPTVARGQNTTVLRKILDQAAGRIGKDLATQPAVAAELLMTIGKVYFAIGVYEQAEPMEREALAIQRKVLSNDDPELAATLSNLAFVLNRRAKQPEAEKLIREALSIQTKRYGHENAGVADSTGVLADVLFAEGKADEAEKMAGEALAIRRKVLGNENPDVATSLQNLGVIIRTRGRLDDAMKLFQEALELSRKLTGDEDLDVARILVNVAITYRMKGKLDKAEPVHRQALAIRKRLLGDEHPDVALSLSELGMVLRLEGKLADAEQTHREALAMRRKLLGNDSLDVADSLNALAVALREEAKLEECESSQREALAIQKKTPGTQPSNIARSLNNLGVVLSLEGKLADAESFHREALAMRQGILDKNHPEITDSLYRLAGVLRDEGRPAEAEPIYRDVLTRRREIWGETSWDVAYSLADLATVCRDQDKLAEAGGLLGQSLVKFRAVIGREDQLVAAKLEENVNYMFARGLYADAEPLARECLMLREEKLPDDWKTFDTRSLLGASLLGRKKYAEAEPLLVSGLQGLKQRAEKIPAESKPRLSQTARCLVQLYEATSQPDKAAASRRELEELQNAEAAR